METEKNIKKDALGDRMKRYENITRTHLMPRSYSFVRADGRAFHSYLKGCLKPFDHGVVDDMTNTAIYLCENIQNAKLGYVQSDEITILLCDFENYETSQFFDGNIQKISSVVASMAAAQFNLLRLKRDIIKTNFISPYAWDNVKLASFDCRCWNVPDRFEAYNTFVWRNQDCSRNSVSMLAQSMFSEKELHGKSTREKIQMTEIKDEGAIGWKSLNSDLRFGRIIQKDRYLTHQDEEHIKNAWDTITGHAKHDLSKITVPVERTRWIERPAWRFTDDRDALLKLIPKYES